MSLEEQPMHVVAGRVRGARDILLSNQKGAFTATSQGQDEKG